ncbi:uncharacterized protein NPIL_106972 [Nephila pilipes]|uniref:Uncharacterized protein n=1 Tax=Nephila pilipes TaxID=299642 RepID=A0A8X6UCW4_NEPPI|nr:uncharacterized protein NPIL_106972 [Nephila pilipes]
MFGVNVSLFLLSATIKHHIEKYREQYPAATEMLDTCLYVDDVISGADDISQALKISKDAVTIMKDASMKLRKWNSNDQALMKTWEYEGLETYPRHSENDSGVQSSKVLGIPWNVIHDYFTIDVKGLLELDTSKPVTKRILLQSAGKIYDPVGFLSPYTIKLKCLLQELWLRKLAWDDELPPDIYATWLQWRFIHNCRTRSAKIKGPLTSQEVSYAENWLIRSLHEKEFPEEMRKLLAEMTEKHARIKQTRQLCTENAKLMHRATLEEKKKILDVIKDTIIVHKIGEKEVNLKILNSMEDENIADTIDALKEAEEFEEKQVADEYEIIVKKQLQMLQADERGRQAFQNEIVEIRKKQEKRAQTLRMRAKALEIEKIRAKEIVSRPPPLPRSLKLLLKEQAKKQSEMANEASVSNLSPLQDIQDEMEDTENKENIDDIYHDIEKRRMQEEWDRKAQKRFHEALKKDRLKQEQAEILKEIENAEKLNRRQMARNISEPMGKVPCSLPDKLHYVEKQAAMECAVEKIFKKSKSTKEYAVEDLDGYEDKFEAKYKEIDSAMESKMIECIPSFLKENYSYLLREETSLPCGKHFSGLDNSIEDLNRAFIESSPTDILNNSKEIDQVISQLDLMRSELNEAYEKEFKPLLEAENVPKIMSVDKAVETDLLKLPTEDKAIEIDSLLPKKSVASSSRSVQVDIMQGGLMSYKRRDLRSIYRSHTNAPSNYLPDLNMIPAQWIGDEPKSFSSGLETWSSSSYRSLPSMYGMPNICKFCDSPNCAIPLVEDEKLHKDCIPLSKKVNKQFYDPEGKSVLISEGSEKSTETKKAVCDKLPSSSIKSKLSSYVQIVADKYLKNKPKSVDVQQIHENASQINEYSSPDSKTDSDSSIAFSKTKFVAHEHTNIPLKCTDGGNIKDFLESPDKVTEKLVHSIHAKSDVAKDLVTFDKPDEKFESNILVHDLMKSPDKKSLLIGLESSIEDELLQKCREIISANLSDMFSSSNRSEHVHEEASHSLKQSADFDSDAELQLKKDHLLGYVYHDLSTIQEMDSALTNESLHSASKELSLDGTVGLPKITSLPVAIESEDISPEEIDTTSVSLVDAPVSEVSKLARSIQFKVLSPESVLSGNDTHGEYESLLSGTLVATPSAATKIQYSESVDLLRTPSIQSFSDRASSYSTPLEIKSSESSDLHTPSSLSTIQSQLSTKSDAMPYSSSFKVSSIKHQHLTNISPLSKYFRDVSSVKCDSGTSSSEITSVKSEEYSIPYSEKQIFQQPVSFPIHSQRQFEMHESSSNSFKPMTPQSCVSTPSGTYTNPILKKKINLSHYSPLQEKNISAISHSQGSTSNSFKPMTPHSYLTSPSKSHQHTVPPNISLISAALLEKIDDNSSGSFKPLSFQSDISTPKNASPNDKNIDIDEKDTHYVHDKDSDQQCKNNGSSFFQPLSMQSDISTPRSISPKDKNVDSSAKNIQFMHDNYKDASLNYENITSSLFQPMTPQSYLSTRATVNTVTSSILNESSAGKEVSTDKKLETSKPLRSNVFNSGSVNIQNKKQGAFSNVSRSIIYPLQLDFDVSMTKHIQNPVKDLENYIEDGSYVHKLSKEDLLKSDPSVRHKYLQASKTSLQVYTDSKCTVSNLSNKHFKKDSRTVKVPSSGFVPHLVPADFTSSEGDVIDDNERGVSVAAKITEVNTTVSSESPTTSTPLIINSQSVDLIPSQNIKDMKTALSVMNSVWEPDSNAIALPRVKSSNPILDALKHNHASSKFSFPCATPSNGSSTENLSEKLFGESKITYQSTPVKSIEEIIQETGILDEPDLTLVNTEYTIKPDSPEKPRRLVSESCSLLNEDFKTPTSSQIMDLTPSKFVTPTDKIPSPFCDSPSLISFLKHEQSCFSNYNPEEKKQWSIKKVSKHDYKKRTKRLWNNLEEIKTKKLMEEKRKQLAKNRLKMKAYSKKLTTPKKKDM